MQPLCVVLAVVGLALLPRIGHADDFDPAAIEYFEREIRPLLVQKCFECHGDVESPKGGLKLTSRAAVLVGGDSGPAAVVSKPQESGLIEAISYDSALRMPPKEKLSQADIDRLTKWIALGLPWPNSAPPPGDPKSAPVGRFHITPEQKKFWSFQPLRVANPPAVTSTDWPRGEIDRFILAGLEQQGLSPTPAASKRVLLRRATYDLTGLPPTPEELREFETDDSPYAFAKVVNRLLASPAYGEHWGRHWLDVVRYADSRDARYVGAGHDITEAWRYRDWVINAFNRDLPFDQFIVHQIAGDLLPAATPGGVNVEGLIATGFLAIGEWGTGDSDAQKMHTDMVDDQVNAVSRTFLSLTVGCARCHDHKFDPISTADYYALAGIFFSTQIATPQTSAQMVRVPLVPQAEVDAFNQYMAGIAEKDKNIQQFTNDQYALLVKGRLQQTAQYLLAAWDFHQRGAGASQPTIAEVAKDRSVDSEVLGQWLDYLGWSGSNAKLLPTVVRDFAGQSGVFAWKGEALTPVVALNSNDRPAMVPGTLPPRSLAMHPSPAGGVAVGWQSPLSGLLSITGNVADAHVGCGDGVDWSLELCRPESVQVVAQGSIAEGGTQALAAVAANRLDKVEIQTGDLLRLVVRPKADYGCDMTSIDLEIREQGGQARTWNLTRDLLANPSEGNVGNPHADAYGNRAIWHLYDIPSSSAAPAANRAADSPLTAFLAATNPSANVPADRVAIEAAARQLELLVGEVAKNPPAAPPAPAQAPVPPAVKFYQELLSDQGPLRVAKRDNDRLLPESAKQMLKSMAEQLEALKKNTPPPLPMALVAREGGVPGTKYAGFNDVQIHVRGRYDRLGDKVPRRFPEILAGDQQPPIIAGSGRLELARWLAKAENPLTARVMVNRIWQNHFGTGLVRTSGNFGIQGEAPTHPELLDLLAHRFIESGWSIKAMHRAIMLSAAYQQSSAASPQTQQVDPENRLVSRANVRRLEAEAIRDTMLYATGKLDRTMGGPSIREPAHPRRAVYTMTIRSVKTGFAFLFDMADPEIVVDQRTTSTVAPQSLYLMNGEFVMGSAASLAERLSKDAGDEEVARIQRAYELLFGRAANASELALGSAFLERARQRALGEGQAGEQRDAASRQAWEAYCQTLLCANELIYVD